MNQPFTVFVEYKLRTDSIALFLDRHFSEIRQHVADQVEHVLSHEFLIAQAQEGQIVEVIQVVDESAILQLRELRTGLEQSWFHTLDSHIVGGRSKIKLWSFRKHS